MAARWSGTGGYPSQQSSGRERQHGPGRVAGLPAHEPELQLTLVRSEACQQSVDPRQLLLPVRHDVFRHTRRTLSNTDISFPWRFHLRPPAPFALANAGHASPPMLWAIASICPAFHVSGLLDVDAAAAYRAWTRARAGPACGPQPSLVVQKHGASRLHSAFQGWRSRVILVSWPVPKGPSEKKVLTWPLL